MQAATESRGALKVEWLGANRGFGVICHESKSVGDVLFIESPAALFQPNRALVNTCSSPQCMRVIGSVQSLVDRSHAFYRSVAQVSTVRLEGEEADRARKSQLMQGIMQHLPADANIVPCRGSKQQTKGDSCSHVYCSAECEEFNWLHGHKFLCESSNPLLIPFFQSRNIVRNPDAQIAARILAQFIATVETSATSSSSSSSSSTPSVADQWKKVSNFHAAPWSTVLAVQAIFAQQQVAEFQQIIQAHAEHVNKLDAAATGVSVPAASDPSTALTAAAQASLQQLNSTQLQYRAALKEGFALLHDALSRGHSSSPSSASWLPYINLENFDRLAGANRLNNTQTQTVLPVPTLPPSLQQLTQSLESTPDSVTSGVESLNLLTANEDTVAEAAVSSPSSSSEPPLPFLYSCLLSLFSPMSLPRADAKALLHFHSKMNHSCAPNARVENWLDGSNVAFTSKSMEIVQQQQEDKSQLEESMSHGNKKKKQKNKLKKAEAQRKEKREFEILEKIEAHFQKQTPAANTTAASSTAYASSSTAEPDLRAASTCTIVVRAVRPIAAGDEVCISYTPSTAAFRSKSVRKDYLQKQYLFTCSCTLCGDK